jgi:hypothetical protein
MKQKARAYRKRVFLNPISTGEPSFVFAVADSSDGGERSDGNYVLTLGEGDSKRIIEIEFPLTSSRLRKQSLAKIDALAQIINRFKDKIHSEADLINQRRRK